MKICSNCKKEKKIEEFSFRNKKINLKQKECKECMRKRNKVSYYANREYYAEKQRKWHKKISYRNHKIIINYLLQHPCIDCGEKDIIVLEFDHDRDKKIAISRMLRRFSVKSLLDEIKKCKIRCANCHRRKTAKQFESYRAKYSGVV